MSPEAARWRALRERIERMRIRPLGAIVPPIAPPAPVHAKARKART